MQYIKRRNLVRMVSFLLALIATLAIFSYANGKRADAAELELEYQYLKSLDDLANYMDSVDATLLKIMYSGDTSTMAALTSKLWREAGFAKDCLSSLPISYLKLENTYKFLSQVGDYAVSLSNKMADGYALSDEERENLAKLKEYSHQFLQEILAIQDAVRTGSISFREVKQDISKGLDETLDNSDSIGGGFQEFEEGFTAYPTLIYDGPFSDNILEREPAMTAEADEISQEEAMETAKKATGIEDLEHDYDEDGKMPSYCFTKDNTTVAVTKQGGFVSYMMTGSQGTANNIDHEQAIRTAEEYLDTMGITGVEQTYFEVNSGAMTINYAAVQNDVMCYTDLIKVVVSMESGRIAGYDARGYLVNHTKRDDLKATIGKDTASEKLSPLLSIEKTRLSIIPSSGLEERLCYEFKCKSDSGDDVLVYINAKTGKEEQILILYIDENGSLTI